MADQGLNAGEAAEAEARLVETMQQGDHATALRLAKSHLARHPDAAFARTIIGMCEARLGNLKGADTAFRAYAEARPDDPAGWTNLGKIQRARGQTDKAAASFRKATELAPGDVAAWTALGAALGATGKRDAALEALETAARLTPESPAVLIPLGEAYLRAGQAQRAEAALARAVTGAPKNAAAHLIHGLALRRLGRLPQSAESLRRAASLAPKSPKPLLELSRTLAVLGRTDDALGAVAAARRIDPNLAGAASWQGRLLVHKGDVARAIAAYSDALKADPKDAALHFSLGNLLYEEKGYAAALSHLKATTPNDPTEGITAAALALRAKKPEIAHKALNRRDLPREPSLAVSAWNVACQTADFRKRKQFAGLLPRLTDSRPDRLGDILGLTSVRSIVATDDDIALYLGLQKRWSDALVSIANDAPLSGIDADDPPEGGRLRIAFVTMAGIRGLDLALLPLVRDLDRTRFEVIWIVAGGTQADRAYWSRFDDAADRVLRLGSRDDHSLAKVLAGLGLDIVIDLNGIQQPGSLVGALAWKPAKLQMTWAGSPTECRLEALDYQILDGHLTAPEGSSFAARDGCQPLVMPAAWMSIGTLPDIPMRAGLPSDETGAVTFGNMLTPDKLTPEVVALWSEVLRTVPDSRLILSRPEYGSALLRENVLSAFAREGLKDAVEFRSTLEPGQSHLTGYADFDIALDAYPVGGGVTVAEALWMGVPCITRTGPLVQHRVGLSVLAAVGAEDLATETDADFVSRAMALAADGGRRRSFRQSVRDRMADAALFRHDIFTPQFADTMWDLAKAHGLRA